METDLERLVVQLSADIKQYQRGLQNAMGVTNKQARAIENRWKQSEKNLNAIGAGMASGLLAPLGGIAAALTAREVLSYADAWTKAKNSLAVAGVTGAMQAVVLDRLYQSAQKNAVPIGALTDLYGKAAQAADNLGASNQQLIDFSDGVATALKVAGTGASEASGALTQLGQLLGSARVQAEEFNSVNEGARPILIAVANGLDAAGGSVNRLKQLVNDGKVSGQQFFQAFLKGLPTIQAAAANSTQTIEQGVTKVTNAFTKYVGQTDESLGASQRLVAGLNALADNFQETADIVVQLASIIAGALVGRAIAGMVAQLGLATTAARAFITALRAATTIGGVATAIGGLSAAAGPLGLVIGGTVVAALTLFSGSAAKASDGARGYAEALRRVDAAASAAAQSTQKAAQSLSAEAFNKLSASVREGEKDIASANAAAVSLFSTIIANAPRRLISGDQLAGLEELRDKLLTGQSSAGQTKDALYALANSNPQLQKLADQLAPLLDRLARAVQATGDLKAQIRSLNPSFGEIESSSLNAYEKAQAAGAQFIKDAERKAALSKDQLDLEKQIADVQARAAKAGVTLSDKQAKDLAQKELAADERRKAEGKDTTDEYDRQVQSLQKSTDALKVETETLGKSTYEIERAKAAQELLNAAKEAGRAITPQLTAEINAEADAHARAAAALADAQKKQESNKELTSTLGNELVNGIVDLASGAQSLNDILNDTSKLIAKLILQALLLGQGPLATMFGTSSGGGILGAFSSSSSAAFGSGGIGHAASGGQISGPGTGTSDSIPTMLSDGEYVVRSSQARKHRALLDAINSGKILRRAAGGPVGLPSIPRPSVMGGTSVQVVNNTGVQAGARTETARGPNGQAVLRIFLDAARKDFASGGYDGGVRGRYALAPAPVRRG
ncbi:tape measure protein [Xanthobacter sp.]|uniref:tape measure protein n=1 Tax=Xanthobacter sp. TaxID=35809 RepID=UPI0025D7CD57|nr:tape measure protein [Xanthobacter sp.]